MTAKFEQPQPGDDDFTRGGGPFRLLSTETSVPPTTSISGAALDLLDRAALLIRPRSPARPLHASDDELAQLDTALAGLARALPVAPPPSAQAGHFDRRFGIVRSDDADAAVAAIVAACTKAVRVCRNPVVGAADIAAIVEGLWLSVRRFQRGAAARMAAPLPVAVEDHAADRQGLSAMLRWLEGHQLFCGLGQELRFNLHDIIEALAREDWARASAGYGDAVTMLRAIAAAMRATGAMTAGDYVAVRESMAPPAVPENFSGLWDPGHAEILRLSRAMHRLPHTPQLEVAEDSFYLAIDLLYFAHAWVCALVAGQETSLAAGANPAAPPAHISLRHFARRALVGAGFPKEQLT